MGVRRPWVAGSFYPADRDNLIQTIEECFTHQLGPGKHFKEKSDKRDTISVVCPHAGYMYSGPAAAHIYHQLMKEPAPESIVILSPNHTGLGSPISIWGTGVWETPLGKATIDEELARAIFKASDLIDIDELAHIREHSIEVHIPFLQYIYRHINFVAICMGFQDLETSRKVGKAIVDASIGRDVLLLASTDLTHMESKTSANIKDQGVIERILSLNEGALQEWVRLRRVSMCGYGPVSAALYASKQLGAKNAELLKYYTSGDITGDVSAVVGYAAIRISR
jgi:AmmeMemoRadiSam system protein B